MGMEIERKFLLENDCWKDLVQRSEDCRQGYLHSDEDKTVRVRIMGDVAYLTIKGRSSNISRKEFEYTIPVEEAEQLLLMCEGHLIEKTRSFVPFGDHVWEIDEFFGDNEGLVMAEVELETEDESFEKPFWIGKEVSGDACYYNACLVKYPYSRW